MTEENDNHESPNVFRIVEDVRDGVRTKRDLEVCGCPLCQEALRLLNEGVNH